jgi:protein adenylyltransferase
MRPLIGLAFDNSYARLHPGFYEVVDPTPLPDPGLVAFNPDAAALIDLDPAECRSPDAASYLSGGLRIPGAEPIAQAYAGHQFGVWVPQLGDGRAFLLGEARNARGESWDLHLKGGGQTRWSRHGDGRSVLRSAVREYLASEALHGLGIPTTRALCIVGSALPVQRERMETAATIIRLAPSHVRFGTFQYFAARGATDRVRELADHVIERHFVQGGDGPLRFAQRDDSARGDIRRYAEFFAEVCRRTARLMARWMAAGFAHGVMNTDNMSILGITLDYGPYGFLDHYDAGFICNHTDTGGQYAFDRQPSVGMWNCARLGEALMVLAGESVAMEPWQEALESYWGAFGDEYAGLMRARLGLLTEQGEDAILLRDLLALLQAGQVDFTRFFRELADVGIGQPTAGPALQGMFDDLPALDAWLGRYVSRLVSEGSDDAGRRERMRRTNPKYVLRNWVAQEAIAAAERGSFDLIESLRVTLASPCDEHPHMERFAAPPTSEGRRIEVSCSS